MAKIKGINQAINALKNLRKKSEEATQVGILRTAKLIEADAKAHVPRNMGLLEASIGIERKENSVFVYANAKHAPYQEFGTGPLTEAPKGFEQYTKEFFVNGKGVTPAKPFLFPAYFKYQETVITNVEEELQKVADEFNRP